MMLEGGERLEQGFGNGGWAGGEGDWGLGWGKRGGFAEELLG